MLFILCSYGVEVFSAEEVGWYGPFGIKLRSHADAKRVWLFRAENEEDQQQWIEVGAPSFVIIRICDKMSFLRSS